MADRPAGGSLAMSNHLRIPNSRVPRKMHRNKATANTDFPLGSEELRLARGRRNNFLPSSKSSLLVGRQISRTSRPSLSQTPRAWFYRPLKPPGDGSCSIEKMPNDILHIIFRFADWNVDLPRSSHYIGMQLSNHLAYNEFSKEMLCFKVDVTWDADNSDFDPREIKGCHSFPSVTIYNPDLKPSYIQDNVQKALNSRWVTYDYLTGLRDTVRSSDRTFLGRTKINVPHPKCFEAAPDRRFPHRVEDKAISEPINTKHCTVRDICLSGYFVPPKLCAWPPKPGSIELLNLLYGYGCPINYKLMGCGDFLKHVALPSHYAKQYALLWTLLKPGSGWTLAQSDIRDLLVWTKCDRDMIEFIVAYRKAHSLSPQRSRLRGGCVETVDWLDICPEVTVLLRERYGKYWKDLLAPQLNHSKSYKAEVSDFYAGVASCCSRYLHHQNAEAR